MILFAAFVVAAVAAVGGWVVLRPLLSRPPFLQENFRGEWVPNSAGLVLVAAVVVGEIVVSALARVVFDLDIEFREPRRAVVAAVVGFGLLGLLDDLAGDSSTTGYRGHLSALLRGEVTSGAVKIVGGAIIALAAVVMATDEPIWLIMLDAALVALSANLANLFDRRPGRVIKVGLGVFAVLVAVALLDPALAGVALALGAALGLLRPDLRADLMLGDTGSNPIGAALGLGAVIALAVPVRLSALVVVLALNLASERVSFTDVIERHRPLRYIDQLGRRP